MGGNRFSEKDMRQNDKGMSPNGMPSGLTRRVETGFPKRTCDINILRVSAAVEASTGYVASLGVLSGGFGP
jgi:hypothetical protein